MFAVLLVFVVSCSPSPKELLISKIDKVISTNFVPNLKDPKSFEKIGLDISDSVYVNKKFDHINITLKYRAKNSFGGYVINEQLFMYLSKEDKVIIF